MPVTTFQLTWETDMVTRVREMALDHPEGEPLMVACAGIPGSGKSTSARHLAESLSDLGCLLMPFDGYHYTMAVLKSWENADDAIYRRGAPDTFDSDTLHRDLMRIRSGDDAEVFVPGFDHAVGDPSENEHHFKRSEHKVVICEGLYLLHDEDGWSRMKDCFDMSIFIDADVDVCMGRLKIRNRCIPGYTPEQIDIRVDAVDRKNADLVVLSKSRADIVVSSAALIV